MNEKLRDIRISRGITMEMMAERANISKAYYSMIEHGDRRVSYELAYKLSKVLNKTPDQIFLDYQSTLSEHDQEVSQ